MEFLEVKSLDDGSRLPNRTPPRLDTAKPLEQNRWGGLSVVATETEAKEIREDASIKRCSIITNI
jgi:hypothetical protein